MIPEVPRYWDSVKGAIQQHAGEPVLGIIRVVPGGRPLILTPEVPVGIPAVIIGTHRDKLIQTVIRVTRHAASRQLKPITHRIIRVVDCTQGPVDPFSLSMRS